MARRTRTCTRTRWIVLLVALALSATAYGVVSRQELTAWAHLRPIVVHMKRTCEACPNYSITLSSDGTMTYEGGDYTAVEGLHNFYVDKAVANAVIDDFVQSDFVELDNTYPAPGSNRMTILLSIEMDGLSKSVLSEERYGPAVRQMLEREMDDLPGMRALSGWTH